MNCHIPFHGNYKSKLIMLKEKNAELQESQILHEPRKDEKEPKKKRTQTYSEDY